MVSECRPASITMPALFCEGMVIQRDIQAPVWGWSTANEQILVSASWGATSKALADDKGLWQVKLQTPEAGGPFTLKITGTGDRAVEINNVYSGDVWLCAGQSNMELPVKKVCNASAVKADALNYPEIKIFKVRRTSAATPRSKLSGSWKNCSPKAIRDFSAAAYFFGQKLFHELHIPIGLIQSAWGATCIEAWTPLNIQLKDPSVAAYKKNFDVRALVYDPDTAQSKYEKQLQEWRKRYNRWKREGRMGNRPVRPDKEKHPLRDQNYPGNLYNGMIHPLVPYGIKGAIWYQGERNSWDMERAVNYHEQLERMISGWRNDWKQGDFPFYLVQLPNFREGWSQPVMRQDVWPYTRESIMFAAKAITNCDMAITIDIGDCDDIHPANKQDVGLRLARLALHKTYGKTGETWNGAIVERCVFEKKRVIVFFDNGGADLTTIDGAEPFGFALAGNDGKIYYANARIIDSNKVEVTSKEVPEPEEIWYAWADNPEGANLCNKAKLPASPFRMRKLNN